MRCVTIRASTPYQYIEIQLLNYSNIPARMAYTWADIYSKQLKAGEKLDNTQLPEWMHTPEMEQVMNVIKRFSEKEAD
ncbi:hypothetical protein FJZ55_01550, partial [Candidatus Woesearchaeota archaeon]|nr:hypothetical protein [Candidatus Woesearchaeota archaeon]